MPSHEGELQEGGKEPAGLETDEGGAVNMLPKKCDQETEIQTRNVEEGAFLNLGHCA